MEMLKQPLAMTQAENRKLLERSEQQRDDSEGYSVGNRHHRRAMAKRDREDKKQKA